MENFLNEYNVVTPVIALTIILPMIISLITGITKRTVWKMLLSLHNLINVILSVFLAFFLTHYCFFVAKYPFCNEIANIINENFKPDIRPETKIYIYVFPILFIILTSLIRLAFLPIENKIIPNLASKISSYENSLWKPLDYLIRIFSSIPGAILNVFLLCLILFALNMFSPSPIISEQLDGSKIYTFVSDNVIDNMLESQYVQKLPVLIRRTIPPADLAKLNEFAKQSDINGKNGYSPTVIYYFNGVTLDEAIKSNQQIDMVAKNLIKPNMTDRKKAKTIYRWIGSNIKYDYQKADAIKQPDVMVESGAISAFEARKGICFDLSSLYVAMCRANNLKVRLVIGIAYDGTSWGDHAWNQVFLDDENIWVNVDSTFSIGGNYFDRSDFDDDHKKTKIAGEW